MNNIELADHHLKRLHYGIQGVINTPEGHPFYMVALAGFEEVDELFWTDVSNHEDLWAFVAVLIQNEEFANIEQMLRGWNPMVSITGTLEEIHGVPMFILDGKWCIYQD